VALPGDLPLATILPIADALLASPILAVDVAFGGDELPQLLHDLRQRAGDKLLIGVSGVETAVQLQASGPPRRRSKKGAPAFACVLAARPGPITCVPCARCSPIWASSWKRRCIPKMCLATGRRAQPLWWLVRRCSAAPRKRWPISSPRRGVLPRHGKTAAAGKTNGP